MILCVYISFGTFEGRGFYGALRHITKNGIGKHSAIYEWTFRICRGLREKADMKSLYDYCNECDELPLLDQWDTEKNGDLTAREVSHGSHKIIWWRCSSGHSWQAPVFSRTGNRSGCPYCAGKKVLPGEKSLAAEHPELVKEWHPTKNGVLQPDEISSGTHRKVWWQCENGHEWLAQVKARAAGTGCPYCSKRIIISGENDLAATHPDLAAQWNTVKNAPLRPEEVSAGSRRKVWWIGECGHEWQATIRTRTTSQSGCPVCAGKQIIPGENDLQSRFPQIAAQWDAERNGDLTPDAVSAYSNRRAWWRCEKGHVYHSTIAQRTKTASACPYCTGRKVLAGFNDLETLHPKIAKQWHPTLNGALTPSMVTANSHQKVWWQCDAGHVWKTVVYSRTCARKHGCPVCAGRVKKA